MSLERKDYSHTLNRQATAAEEVANAVFGNCMRQIDGLLTVKEIWDAQKVYITGCGDSWLAGVAAKPAFESLLHIDTRAERAVEFSRLLDGKNLGYSPNTPLVVCISFSGGAARAVECARRAARRGAMTLAITNNRESDLAKACRYTLCVDVPQPGEYYPGLNSYNASMIALFVLAIRMARVRNKISHKEMEDICAEFRKYVAECQALTPAFDERAFGIACAWKDLKAEDFVGDYADWATAYFSMAKVIETFGGYSTVDDSEDWCHINYFLTEPERIGRVFYTELDSPSYGRVLESLEAVRKLGSPCMVVTDAPKEAFPERFEVFTLPKAKYFWMVPLCNHIPFDLVSGYIAAMKGDESYRDDMPEFHTPEAETRIKGGTEIVVL